MLKKNVFTTRQFWFFFLFATILALYLYGSMLVKGKSDFAKTKNALEIANSELAKYKMINSEYSKKINDLERELLEKNTTIIDYSNVITSLNDSLYRLVNQLPVVGSELDLQKQDEAYQIGYYIVYANENRKIYFHNMPDASTQRNAYFTTQEEVYVKKIQNGFGYVEFTNMNNESSYGWLEMKYLGFKSN